MQKTPALLLLIATLAQAQTKETATINSVLDNWHKAASQANYDNYMHAMTNDAVFIGTDPTVSGNRIRKTNKLIFSIELIIFG